MEKYTLRIIIMNMKTGTTLAYDVQVYQTNEGCYEAKLPHHLYHRIKSHFGKGPFTTEFTVLHGHFLLHGYVKPDRHIQIPVVFKEEKGEPKTKSS
ncbi:MAG: hypothetical protein N3E48_04445 [Candidatus Bathyarchaeota archaeon]|nr:hypothetical protein [Candidatus Bathyarchaeota archaeon]